MLQETAKNPSMTQIYKGPLFILSCLVLCLKVSCIHTTLKQGDALNSSSQLLSPNRRFTLQFFTPQSTNSTYIAIFFTTPRDAPFENPPLWIGNRDRPLPTSSTPSLTLTTTGELTLTRRDGGEPTRLYAGGSQLSNVTATLLDTGNLIVQSSNGHNQVLLWQSFDHPTDTLLPGMKLGANSNFSSWLSPTNPASGAFALEWDPISGELLIGRRGKVYWRSGKLEDRSFEGVGNVKTFENFIPHDGFYEFRFNLSGGGEYLTYRMFRYWGFMASGWRLDSTGNLNSIDGGGSSTIMARASACYGYGYKSDYVRGCEVWDQPLCRSRRQAFVRRSGNFIGGGDGGSPTHSNRSSSLSLSDCRDACWNDCECAGYSNFRDEEYGCSYWIGKDLVWDQDDEGVSLAKYVLVSSRKGKKKYVGIVVGVIVSLLLLLMLGFAYFIMRNLKVRREEKLHQLLTPEGYEVENRGGKSHHLKLFTYASILSATTNFSSTNKLGEGGFGPVYKGTTAEGQDIAVKVLSRQSGQGLIEFKNELILISELQHVNLVKLLGFSIHKDEKMIIYDYMPNKSLDCFLFSPSKREQLDWKKRFNIIEGTAQGLLYLHKHSRLKIIHRDMKPNNILLDEDMNPKISDFGLARIFKEDAIEVNTNRRVGTYGYMAPEYAMQGIFSVKSDVYSFGVLVLEIVSGRRNSSFHEIEGPLSIVEYAWELWRKDCALELMDPMLKDSCIIEQLQKCIQIGLLCVENHAMDRPTIEDVLSMLKNEIATLPKPRNPAFITRNSLLQQVEKSNTNTSSNFSANQVTISELDAR